MPTDCTLQYINAIECDIRFKIIFCWIVGASINKYIQGNPNVTVNDAYDKQLS